MPERASSRSISLSLLEPTSVAAAVSASFAALLLCGLLGRGRSES